MLRVMMCFLFLYSGLTQAAIIAGNPQGTVTLVDIYDYQCRHCHREYAVIEQLIAQNPTLTVKFMPVAVLNNTSLLEAAAAIAATQVPGDFEQFNAWALQTEPMNDPEVSLVLKSLKLTSPAFFAAMHSRETQAQLLEGLQLLKQLHLDGVPVILIYPTQHPERQQIFAGEQTTAVLQNAIDHDEILE